MLAEEAGDEVEEPEGGTDGDGKSDEEDIESFEGVVGE